MDKYDERQEQVRGKIMTRSFTFTIILLLLIAFINDMHAVSYTHLTLPTTSRV